MTSSRTLVCSIVPWPTSRAAFYFRWAFLHKMAATARVLRMRIHHGREEGFHCTYHFAFPEVTSANVSQDPLARMGHLTTCSGKRG